MARKESFFDRYAKGDVKIKGTGGRSLKDGWQKHIEAPWDSLSRESKAAVCRILAIITAGVGVLYLLFFLKAVL